MSKFMMIAGLLLAAAGIALGLMVYFSPGKLMTFGVSPDVAATLLVGGILAMGLGGVIAGLGGRPVDIGRPIEMVKTVTAPVAAATAAVASQATGAVDDAVIEPAKATTADAVAALEKAKSDIAEALGLPDPEPDAPVLPDAPADVHEVAAAEDEQLFVTEEKSVRGRPARVLSDGTVEAETDEGWMRFENMEHLEEYLEAMEPTAKA